MAGRVKRLIDELIELRAAGGYGPRTSLVLSALDARVDDEQGALAQFATHDVSFDPDAGGRVAIKGSVLDTRLSLEAQVSAIPSDGS